MSGNLSVERDAGIDGPVVELLLNHLGDEKASLSAMLNVVRDVHHALLKLDDESLHKSLEAEARELGTSVAIQERRYQLQDQLAPVLKVAPRDVTLRRLMSATTGSLRDTIEHVWQSLVEMAAEIERLNRLNAAMIGQSLAIARGVVERLTGVTGVGESYNAVGVRSDTHVGPLIQWGA